MSFIHILDHDPRFSNGLTNFLNDLAFEQSKEDNVLIISSADKNKVDNKSAWKVKGKKFFIYYTILKKLKPILNLINDEDVIFFHVTSSLRYFTSRSLDILRFLEKKAFFIFHIDPFYAELVGQLSNIKKLVNYVNESDSVVITFSNEGKKLFKQIGGEKVKKVQMGVNIESILNKLKNKTKDFRKRKYYITTSTSKGIYPYIKGVDRFYDLVNIKDLTNDSLILGVSEYLGIKNVLLNRNEFIDILTKSKALIQLSRSELYSIAVIEAKLAKTPVIVSNIGGLKDNVRYGFKVNNQKEALEILDLIIEGSSEVDKIVEKNYKDSLKRENIKNTWKELKSIKI